MHSLRPNVETALLELGRSLGEAEEITGTTLTELAATAELASSTSRAVSTCAAARRFAAASSLNLLMRSPRTKRTTLNKNRIQHT